MLSGIASFSFSRIVRGQDIVWLLLFGMLHYVSPVRNNAELQLLVGLAAFQVISPKIAWFATPVGNLVSIAVKLFLGWLLIGVTYGVESNYYPILVLPVVSAATTLGPWSTLLTTILASGSFLSFLLFLQGPVPLDQMQEVSLRVMFLPLVGFLTYQLAEANRVEARRYQKAAGDLAVANQSLRDAEEHIRRADRLAALGQLAAGLAHEVRNPLGTIKNSAEILAKRVSIGDPLISELTGYISSEVDRTNMLITRFLQFARPFKLHQVRINITEVIDRAVEQLNRRNPPYPVTVIRNDSPHLRPILLDAELMEQVLVNLLANAAEASQPGSVVTVKTRDAEDAVEISVIDRGSGIDPKDRESIFNPFFTTKPEGVGLGLAIVSKIVDEHGGHILVDSTPGEGSIFRIWLPIAS